MVEVKIDLFLATPPEKAWLYLEDFEKVRQWRTDIQKYEMIDEGEMKVGFKYAIEKHVQNKLRRVDCTVTYLEEGRKIGFEGDSAGFAKVKAIYELVPENEGCRFYIIESVEMYSRLFKYIFTPFIKKGLTKTLIGFLENLKRLVEDN